MHRESTDVLISIENVLKNRTFLNVENIFILLESSWLGGIYIVYLNK